MGRTAEEIHQELFAVVQVQSDLTDSNESAIANAMLAANAEQLEGAEDLIESSLIKGLGLEAAGADLDDVVAQWAGFEPRQGESPAQGAVLELTRDTTVGSMVVDAGAVFATEGGGNVLLGAGIVFLDGSATYPAAGQAYGYAISVQGGTAGNVEQGAIRRVVRAPEDVIGVRNVLAMSNGQARESDAQLRRRFLDFLAGGLTRMPERGLVAVAMAFRNRGVRHASTWVDPSRPYTELVVDDGRGFAGLSATAAATGGTIPANGQHDFWFSAPVVDSEVTLRVNGTPVTPVQWTTLHERGRAWLENGAAIWVPGDTWEVSGHTVYAGVIAELQAVIEGLLTWQGRSMGYRASGARVRVLPPSLEEVLYDVWVVHRAGFDADAVNAEVRAVIENFHLDLEPGAPLLMLRIKGQLDRIEGAANIHLRDWDDPSVEMQDWYPTPRHKLSVQAAGIRINGRP